MTAIAGFRTYTNPVSENEFPDPFVLKYLGCYWGYCTGLQADGLAFGIMRSDDLVHWTFLGGAMEALPGPWVQYWAPAVYHDNGRFLLYYSAGDETHMEIRVATAARPEGPFTDCGHRLTAEDFAIDADVFVDDDGSRYLTYATDFLDRSRVGTGVVIDRLLDPFTLGGDPRPVALPEYDWQLYDPARLEKDGVPWYTVEGPFVLKHKSKYYVMFSGGAWKTGTYAVGYAVADDLWDGSWTQVADGREVLPIMRTIPGKVLGPGHNSVVRGPDNRQLFCIYHRWSASRAEEQATRVLAVDRLEWCGDRLLILGPTYESQPAPVGPSLVLNEGVLSNWILKGGQWSTGGMTVRQESAVGMAKAAHGLDGPSLLVECWIRTLKPEIHKSVQSDECPDGQAEAETAWAGIALDSDDLACLSLSLMPGQRRISVGWIGEGGDSWYESRVPLPEAFDAEAYHLFRIEVDGAIATVSVDGIPGSWRGLLPFGPTRISLESHNTAAAFAGLSITYGWTSFFEEPSAYLAAMSWTCRSRDGEWRIDAGELHGECSNWSSVIEKRTGAADYELVVNARLVEISHSDGCFGFLPAGCKEEGGAVLNVIHTDRGWELECRYSSSETLIPLPAGFVASKYQHFRFWKRGTELTVRLEDQVLGRISAPVHPTIVGLHVDRASASFEMVRLTALNASH